MSSGGLGIPDNPGSPSRPENVGASPKPASPPLAEAHRPAFGRRRLLWATLGIISLWLLRGAWDRLKIRFNTPHESLYEKKTLAEVLDLRDVVRPLIDKDQPFDVVATVWTTIQGARQSWMTRDPEKILFSDTIFRGVSLKDKDAHARVNLSIPLQGFKFVHEFITIHKSSSPADVSSFE